ncbi:MAG: hypothetical protein HOE30_25710 [Deltaproteobacteria bacterium]|nr:hypothetical protein [Deltaproteobacteria bacterium]MBT4637227.1 hypothetical protein [Deltaproteobacteria bacterium]MBT6502447.1 hypothetical protein [Deltaproteobacteria bacterium]
MTSSIRYARTSGLTDREIRKILNMDLDQLDLSALQQFPKQLLHLIQTISQKNSIRFSGFHVTQFMKISDFGIAGYVLMSCRNMAQLQEKYQYYHRLIGNVTRLTVGIEGKDVIFSWKAIKDLPAEIERIVMDYLVASITIHSYELTGKKLQIKKATFSWPAPEDISEYL